MLEMQIKISTSRNADGWTVLWTCVALSNMEKVDLIEYQKILEANTASPVKKLRALILDALLSSDDQSSVTNH